MGIFDGLFGRKQVVDNRQGGPIGAWCQEHNWRYWRRNDEIAEEFTGLPGFLHNDGKEAWHVMRGRHQNHSVTAFHYCYKVKRESRHGRKHVEQFRYQVVGIAIPRPRPTLTVSREFWDSKFDLDLDSVEFNENFKVKIDKQFTRFASDLLHSGMTEWLLADERAMRHKWPFRIEGDNLYTWERWQETPEIEPILERVGYLIDIYQQAPEWVWRY
ncbi:MAG: hypothetical protein GEU98_21475 [Pseudonocardiaceae bacterium]|nr:hypothetical protein [Pseudonocardiaceae bacterium]